MSLQRISEEESSKDGGNVPNQPETLSNIVNRTRGKKVVNGTSSWCFFKDDCPATTGFHEIAPRIKRSV